MLHTLLSFNVCWRYLACSRDMGMEVCCTLGMLEKQQAVELKMAGLTAYNHNLDTSREYYPNIITTRSYDERLETLQFVRDAGINVCSGILVEVLNVLLSHVNCRNGLLSSQIYVVNFFCFFLFLILYFLSSPSKCKQNFIKWKGEGQMLCWLDSLLESGNLFSFTAI